jgi:hypothetical protein
VARRCTVKIQENNTFATTGRRQPGRHTESDVRARCRGPVKTSRAVPVVGYPRISKTTQFAFAFRWFRADRRKSSEDYIRTSTWSLDLLRRPLRTSCCGPHSMHVCWNRGLILGELQMSFTLPYRTKWPRQIPGLCEGIALLSNVLVLHTACHRAVFPTLSLFCLTCIAVQAGGCFGRDRPQRHFCGEERIWRG